MRIAFTSYEYPLETGGGGIGTYLQTVAGLLQQQGHIVVVFTGTKKERPFWENDFVYRVPSHDWMEFNKALPHYFLPLHKEKPFDVLECTDFQACGLSVKKKLPGLPVVVRLHTPLFLVDKLMYRPLPFFKKLRFVAGSLKKLQLPKLPSAPQPADYKQEFELIELAEMVSSPGQSIYTQMESLGFGVKGKTEIVPLPFDVTTDFESIKARPDISGSPHVIFIGRLELRKGVIDLATAIPKVLKGLFGVQFTFIGEASVSPTNGMDMISYLKHKLQGHESSVTFTGKIPRTELISYLNKGDIFVFPSHYESFGLVCCEAMAAGKAVIGSSEGGMAEIIEDGISGILIKPGNPDVIAKTLVELIGDNAKRIRLGKAARQRISQYLAPSTVLEKQIACYRKAMAKCSAFVDGSSVNSEL